MLHQEFTKNIFHIFFVSRSEIHFWHLKGCHVWVNLRIQANFWFYLIMCADPFDLWLHVFPLFLHSFQGQGIHFSESLKLPCPSDLDNSGQLLVLQVLESTDDWVLWISVIPSFPMFSNSRYPFLQYHQASMFGWDQKSRSTFRFNRYYSRVLRIGFHGFS